MVLSSQRSHRSLIPPQYRRFIRMTDHDGRRHRGELRICAACSWMRRRAAVNESGCATTAWISKSFGRSKHTARCAHDRRGMRVAAGEGSGNLDRSLCAGQAPGIEAADRGERFHAGQLRWQAAARGLRRRLHFPPGYRAGRRMACAAIDIFVLPSRSEALVQFAARSDGLRLLSGGFAGRRKSRTDSPRRERDVV